MVPWSSLFGRLSSWRKIKLWFMLDVIKVLPSPCNMNDERLNHWVHWDHCQVMFIKMWHGWVSMVNQTPLASFITDMDWAGQRRHPDIPRVRPSCQIWKVCLHTWVICLRHLSGCLIGESKDLHLSPSQDLTTRPHDRWPIIHFSVTLMALTCPW